MFHFLLSCTSLSINYTLRTGCLLPNIIVATVLLLLYKYIHSTLHTHVPTYTGMHPPTTTHPHSPTHIHTVHTAVNTSMYLRHTVTHTTSLRLEVVVVYRCILLLHSESTSAIYYWLTIAPCVLDFTPSHLASCPLHLALVVFPIISSGSSVPLDRRWLTPAAACAGDAFHSVISADSPLSHLVVSPTATNACGASSSGHWRKNCTDAYMY